jgi:hypothetical protein
VPCGGSAELADGISSVTSSVVGLWGMMADGIFCTGGLTCSATSAGELADVGTDVGTGMDFCRFCWASASIKALHFAWVSATIGWGASALVDCRT